MDISGTQPPARQSEVGSADSVNEQGGSGFLDIRSDLLGGGTIVPAVWFRYMGSDTAYADVAGQISP